MFSHLCINANYGRTFDFVTETIYTRYHLTLSLSNSRIHNCFWPYYYYIVHYYFPFVRVNLNKMLNVCCIRNFQCKRSLALTNISPGCLNWAVVNSIVLSVMFLRWCLNIFFAIFFFTSQHFLLLSFIRFWFALPFSVLSNKIFRKTFDNLHKTDRYNKPMRTDLLPNRLSMYTHPSYKQFRIDFSTLKPSQSSQRIESFMFQSDEHIWKCAKLISNW